MRGLFTIFVITLDCIMTYDIKAPKNLNCTVKLPASKSISNRALVLSALSGGKDMPENLSDCDDTEVMINALHDMPREIDIKAGGTAMRFMTAFLGVTPGEHIITGTERMKHRPIGVLVDSLRKMGAEIEYVGDKGFPPLLVKGKTLDGGWVQIDGSVSSQFISALLMVGPTMRKTLTLQLTGDIISRPYIDLTLEMMRHYGANPVWTGVDTIAVEPVPYVSRPYFIESDWSAASYWYEILALCDDPNAEVRLTGLMDGSSQGDTIVKYIFSLLGVKTSFGTDKQGVPTTVTLRRSGRKLPQLRFDFSNCPDLAQTIVCTCCGMGIPFDFTGLSTLKIKETDRIEALKTELRKLGYVINDRNNNELQWDGSRCEPTMEPIDTYEDHRMAMAFAPLAMKTGGIKINNPQVVSKSYPEYWSDLQSCGFTL